MFLFTEKMLNAPKEAFTSITYNKFVVLIKSLTGMSKLFEASRNKCFDHVKPTRAYPLLNIRVK